MKQDPLIFERTYNAPVELVWQAITDKDQMKLWYFDIRDFKPELGFEFQFDAGDDKRVYRHLCKVTEVIAGKKLAYSWRYEGYEGISYVSFELFDEDGKTRVKLTHEGLETFNTTDPSFARESFAGGWTHILGKSLMEFLEKSAEKV
ncbi:MAG: SRPBCC domain-containing protein [Chitinophagaceae bacterium]